MNNDKKVSQYLRFVNERADKLNIVITQKRVNFLSGERLSIVKANIKILKKYIDKFLDVRNSDIEASLADKNDRESLGSRSYSHHMRPSMMAEFDNAYKVVSNYLQYHVNQIKLPTVFPNGNVKYNDGGDKEQIPEQEENLYYEKCIQVGAPYAPSYIYKMCKKEELNVIPNVAPKVIPNVVVVDRSAWYD